MAQFPSTTNASGIWSLKDQEIAVMGDNWPKVLLFNIDPDAADLFLACSFTSYQAATTGGAYVDVSPQIRTAQSLTPGSAKSWASVGNTSINSGNKAFAQYSDALLFTTQTTQAQLMYMSQQLGSNTARTIEMRLRFPSSITSGANLIATNNFGGGYYPAWQWYIHNTDQLGYFSNSGTSPNNAGAIVNDAWMHIAVCFDGSSNMKMFVNGTMTYNSGYGANSGQSIFTLGPTDWDGIGSTLNGAYINDLRIYNKVKYTGNFTVSNSNPATGGSILA